MTNYFEVEVDPSARQWSDYQKGIFRYAAPVQAVMASGKQKNLIVQAGPGSGKSTTAVEFAGRTNSYGMVCAFNTHIVEEIKPKVPKGFDVRTIHSLGNRAIKDAGIAVQLSDDAESKYSHIAKTVVFENPILRAMNSGETFLTIRQLRKICDFARLTLTPTGNTMLLEQMAINYDLDYEQDMFQFVETVLERGADHAMKMGDIDYTDMIYLPNRWKLTTRPHKWVIVDETQDLSAAQAGIVRMMMGEGSRLLAIGDVNQSLQSFAGADSQSMARIKKDFDCDELPLSVCYRCPISHIELANSVFPGIEPAPGALDGEIIRGDMEYMAANARPGDMILSRFNAPVIGACVEMVVKRGMNARVRGRDVGFSLAQTVKDIGLSCKTYNDFPDKLEAWYQHRLAAMGEFPPGNKLNWLNDTRGALKACFEGFGNLGNVMALASKIHSIFDDKKSSQVVMSTVHRSKGLEADRVFLMDYDKLGDAPEDANQTEWETEQKVKYVAVTRSKRTLVLL